MKLYSEEGIILRAQDFQENGRLVTFLSAQAGCVRGIITGSRKLPSRGVGDFEPLTRGVLHYTPGRNDGLARIRKCDPLPPYLYLRQDYERYCYGGYLAELISLGPIARTEVHAHYNLLRESLEHLYSVRSVLALPWIRLRFELRWLELLGLQPQWYCCVICGAALDAQNGSSEQPEALWLGFSPQHGGILCAKCARRGRVRCSMRALRFLKAWSTGAKNESARPSLRVLGELEGALQAHLAHHLPRLPRALALLPTMEDLNAISSHKERIGVAAT